MGITPENSHVVFCPNFYISFFSPFNCCLSVVFCLIKEITPKICMLCCVIINSVVLNLVCPFFIFIFIYDMYFVVTSNATKHEIHTNKILTALVIFMIMHMEGKSFRYCCCWFALETLR